MPRESTPLGVPSDRFDQAPGIAVSEQRFPLFDGLRAMAVLAVAYSHWIPAAYQLGIPWGRLGVQVFFVLSGFLITTILLRECARIPQASVSARWALVRAFVGRRALRIFPIYWLTLTVLMLIGLPEMRDGFWWHFLYASNILFALRQEWAGPISHFWTLGVEEQFYLAWPLLIAFTLPSLRNRLVAGLIVICIATSIWIGSSDEPRRSFAALLPVPAFLAIACGAILAITSMGSRTPHRLASSGRLAGAGLVLTVVSLAPMVDPRVAPLAHALSHIAIVAFALAIVAWAARPQSGLLARVLTARPLVYLGMISYGFYLYHAFAPPLLSWLSGQGWLPSWVNWGLQAPVARFLITLVLATISWYLIERPLNRFKDRIRYSTATVPTEPRQASL